MIRYALICQQGHQFESWFQDSAAYDKQAKRGLVSCPHCGSAKVEKAIMFSYDQGWLHRIREAVMTGLTAEASVERVQSDTRARMLRASDHYLRDRLHDLDDLANRLMRVLMGQDHEGGQDVGGLPAFITGGGQPQQNSGQNGYDQGDRGQDRFGHRRRRRHRGGGYRPDRPDRQDFGGGHQQNVAPQPTPDDNSASDEPRQPE